MSETIIRARNISKVYRLYSKPHYRFMDMFGLLKDGPGKYTEHMALDSLDLSIQRGEKIAIIGRNGAGKSTLLKLISQVIEPTSGTLEVNQKIFALLQIGTGFHPEFTGRENIYSYLAQLGVVGEEADGKIDQIIDFAELEEYIDQPIKTYSTGMNARLMFSVSTSVSPKVLIIDEVLGVGDAYFHRKSFERMEELCSSSGTTLLFVTHDVYSALKICNRFLWLDNGRLVMDDVGAEVIKSYEASIRLQEEDRLRKRTFMAAGARGAQKDGDSGMVFFQIVPRNRAAMEENLTVAGIRMELDDGRTVEIPMKSGGDESGGLILSKDAGNWGDAYQRDEGWVRDFNRFGSIFHRAPFMFRFPQKPGGKLEGKVILDVLDECKGAYYLEAYYSDGNASCWKLDLDGSGANKTLSFPVNAGQPTGGRPQTIGLSSQAEMISGIRVGSRRLGVTKISIKDGGGHEKRVFDLNSDIEIVMRFEALDKKFEGKPVFMFTIHKEGRAPSARMLCKDKRISASEGAVQEVSVRMTPALLGPGSYSVVLGIFEEGYFEDAGSRHMSTNPMVMDIIKDAVHFEIQDNSIENYRVDFVQPSQWSVRVVKD